MRDTHVFYFFLLLSESISLHYVVVSISVNMYVIRCIMQSWNIGKFEYTRKKDIFEKLVFVVCSPHLFSIVFQKKTSSFLMKNITFVENRQYCLSTLLAV